MERRSAIHAGVERGGSHAGPSAMDVPLSASSDADRAGGDQGYSKREARFFA